MEKATITIENEDKSKRVVATVTDNDYEWDINFKFDPPIDKNDESLFASLSALVLNSFTE